MKKFSTLLALLIAFFTILSCSTSQQNSPTQTSQTPSPSKPKLLWTTKDTILNPESALYDPITQLIYVSNVAGGANTKDRKGWISKLEAKTGKVLSAQWIKGLNAPKGMGIFKDTLWVTDINELIGISLIHSKIIKRIKVSGAQFLNDITIGPKGEVYFSDMFTGIIHVYFKGKLGKFAQDPEGELPNGLHSDGNSLFVANWGTQIAADFSTKTLGRLIQYNLISKERKVITVQGLGHLDGLEKENSGSFLVSDWMNGKIFRVQMDGSSQEILQLNSGSADIGYHRISQMMIVPEMNLNQVSAYQL